MRPKVGMLVIWGYDLYPFCDVGTISLVKKKGFLTHGGFRFDLPMNPSYPYILVDSKKGKLLEKSLNDLKVRRTDDIQKIRESYEVLLRLLFVSMKIKHPKINFNKSGRL